MGECQLVFQKKSQELLHYNAGFFDETGKQDRKINPLEITVKIQVVRKTPGVNPVSEGPE